VHVLPACCRVITLANGITALLISDQLKEEALDVSHSKEEVPNVSDDDDDDDDDGTMNHMLHMSSTPTKTSVPHPLVTYNFCVLGPIIFLVHCLHPLLEM